MTDRPLAAVLRPVRSGVFAAASLALAVAAHVIGGGVAPGPAVLTVLGAALWLLAGAAAGKERGGRFVGVAVLGTQVLLHGAFTAVQRPPQTAPNASLVDLLLCHHGGAVDPAQAAAAQRLLGSFLDAHAAGAAAPAGIHFSPWSMLAAHLVAAGLMAWWLRRGERAAWTAIRRAAHGLAALLPAMSPPPSPTMPLPAAARPVDQVNASVRELLRNTAHGMRGPPRHRPCVLSRSLTRWPQPVRA